jgi:pyruvate/2-oxoglutarate dehydrogenase complex dihydrolipoamide dehydrogenase (E3) component
LLARANIPPLWCEGDDPPARDQLLPREDRDVAEFLECRLINEGVRIIKNADARSVATIDAGKVALEFLDRQSGRLAERTFFTDALLIAIGRTPNFRRLDLNRQGLTSMRAVCALTIIYKRLSDTFTPQAT